MRSSDSARCTYTGKVRYGHRESAERAVASMLAKGRGQMDAFECPDCEGWHIGHSHRGLTSFWRKIRLQLKWESAPRPDGAEEGK